MAIGTPTERYAQSRSAQGASTTLGPATTIAAGTVAIMAVTTSVDGKVVSSVTDNVGGNTWNVDVAYDAVAANHNISFISCNVVNAIGTSAVITINYAVSTNNQAHIWIQEVTGLANPDFDKSATGTLTSNTPATGSSGALSQADEIVFGCLRHDDITGWTKEASYTAATSATIGAFSALIYKIVAATTAVTASGTVTNSGAWAMALATYKGAASGTTYTKAGFGVEHG